MWMLIEIWGLELGQGQGLGLEVRLRLRLVGSAIIDHRQQSGKWFSLCTGFGGKSFAASSRNHDQPAAKISYIPRPKKTHRM